jgi:hypothetical protein
MSRLAMKHIVNVAASNNTYTSGTQLHKSISQLLASILPEVQGADL